MTISPTTIRHDQSSSAESKISNHTPSHNLSDPLFSPGGRDRVDYHSNFTLSLFHYVSIYSPHVRERKKELHSSRRRVRNRRAWLDGSSVLLFYFLAFREYVHSTRLDQFSHGMPEKVSDILRRLSYHFNDLRERSRNIRK